MTELITNFIKAMAVVAVIFIWVVCLPVIAVYALYNGLRYGEWDAGWVSELVKAWRETYENLRKLYVEDV